MDTKTLVEVAKARFSHNAAKAVLTEKYNAKLMVAEQGGLWKSDVQTISFLSSIMTSGMTSIVMLDTFGNPILVNVSELYPKLVTTYDKVMLQWHDEWKTLEEKR